MGDVGAVGVFGEWPVVEEVDLVAGLCVTPARLPPLLSLSSGNTYGEIEMGEFGLRVRTLGGFGVWACIEVEDCGLCSDSKAFMVLICL
jgi:hypothetical protein